jgi:hypothetical protein
MTGLRSRLIGAGRIAAERMMHAFRKNGGASVSVMGANAKDGFEPSRVAMSTQEAARSGATSRVGSTV